MTNFRRWSLSFFSGCLLVLLAAVWNNFAPLPLGGQAVYIIINGNSMEPGYHLGDLVIVRPQLNYDIGDAVAYRDLDLGRIVFHRIVKQDVDGYILKGDHNSWVDSYHPISGQILGKAWIHLPGIGKAVAWLRTPIVLTAIVSLTAGTLLVGWFIQPKRRRVRGRD